MRVTVDREVCQGHARCAAFAPNVFTLDDQGFSIADNRLVAAADEEAARRAVASCPEGAISIDQS